jgi:hypothetical protein
LAITTQPPSYTNDAEHNDDDGDTPDDDIDADDSNTHETIYNEDTLLAIKSAVSDTYRGYCGELFVYVKCARQNSGCTFDHSAAGQERCIQSFTLLTKCEL